MTTSRESKRGQPEPRLGVRTHAATALLAAAGLLVLSAFPAPVIARSRRGTDPWPRTSPQERALTGGIARLRAPASTMIRVPASTFQMGSTQLEVLEAVADCRNERRVVGRASSNAHGWPGCSEELFSVELHRHTVRLSSYWLDRTEVTVAAFARCVELRRCQPARLAQGAKRLDRPTYPVSLVSFKHAADYCRFRRARLPTEAEFERAARGTQRRKYPWGNLFNSRACNHGRLGWTRTDARDGFAELAPVGSFPAGRTPEGFLDLAGNVAEWVGDTFALEYPAEDVEDPTGPAGVAAAAASVRAKVVRGGGFQSAAPFLRGAARAPAEPNSPSPTIGLRCARSAGR